MVVVNIIAKTPNPAHLFIFFVCTLITQLRMPMFTEIRKR